MREFISLSRRCGLLLCLAWLSIPAAFSQAPNSDPGEGKLVPSTRTDQKMNTHIWIWGGPKGIDISPTTTTKTTAYFHFFVGKYASGDWNVNEEIEEGRIVGGSVSNLAQYVKSSSQGKVMTGPTDMPLDLSRERVLNTMRPPFLFLTGTKDFVFANIEVEELRKYLRAGGCLWVDNGSPGPDSPFDKAFRREISRVMPDKEHVLKPMPMTHPLFSRSWNLIQTLASGSTGLTTPLEQIEIDGTMGVLYMPNGYAALWSVPHGQPEAKTEERVRAYELGMNCVIYLLTRWDERILFPEGISPR
ncbi:MAG: hypothetical protein B9S32_13005 [Verrucomicrobia bacterium Tous-C9LFEB]|nr:MAG: hypothetical protein B9S32_13005 [Verrucomicrobia bacterium Tous-C9LFEB]